MENKNKELNLDSMYLVQDALKSKRAMESRNRELKFEEETEFEEWEMSIMDKIFNFMHPLGIMILWCVIPLLIFWLGIGNL